MPTKKTTRAPITHYAKAIVAFLAPVITQLALDLQGVGLTAREIAVNVTTGFLTALVVWAVPNSPPA